VNEGCGFHDIGVNSTEALDQSSDVTIRRDDELLGDASRDLSYFKGVRQAVVEDVSFDWTNNLRNASEATKSGGVENPVTIALARCTLVRHSSSVLTFVPGAQRHDS
jgi:hypothetical protein